MRRREPSCPAIDEDVPSCATGPGGQLRFVARELAGIARGVLSAGRCHHAADEERDDLGDDVQSPSRGDGIAR